MNWIIFAIGAICAGGMSDVFRKLGSQLDDPFFSNLIFQSGSVLTAIVLYLLLSRRFESNVKGITFAFCGGILISLFTTLSFKALAVGPDITQVIPLIRIGVVILVVLFGILIFKDKLTVNLFFGLLLAGLGVYLISR